MELLALVAGFGNPALNGCLSYAAFIAYHRVSFQLECWGLDGLDSIYLVEANKMKHGKNKL